VFAELYGKATGVAGGKGGSMHLIDMSHNVLGASAVVGTTIPVAVGFGISRGEHAAAAARAGADGVIVGSRLVRAAAEAEDPVQAVGQLVGEFGAALRSHS